MSDNTVGTSGIGTGDAEPSMEDILASIRKVIAGGENSVGGAIATAGTDTLIQKTEVEILEPHLVLEDLVVDAENRQDESAQTPGDDSDIIELVDIMESKIGFSENLDLVIESDETDYLSKSLTSGLANDLKEDDGFEPIEIDDWKTKRKLAIVANSATGNSELTDVKERLSEARGIAREFESEQAEITAQDVKNDDVPDDLGMETLKSFEALSTDINETGSLNDKLEEELLEAKDNEDEDIDLVKSLLADLMVEPEPESVDIDTENKGEIEDTIFDEMLEQAVSDEEMLSDDAPDDGIMETAKLAEDDTDEDDTDTGESDLARIAREAMEVKTLDISKILNDDVVSLPENDVKSQLTLMAGTVTVATVGSGALTAEADETDEKAIQADTEQAAKEELADILDLKEESKIGETHIEEISTEQENEYMAKTAKKESEPMSNAERDAGDSFASLTHAVKEKTQLEENGPPIGDMVKEALKPMLQDWLDKNLKGIVQRAVTAEIKRISSNK
ncbi:MAG: DUF2497 domain-containing protein [Robiginitomaculum sp.]